MSKYLGLPKAVSDRFLELFCVASYDRGRAGYATTKHLKDRRVIYTLVMYLLAHGKEMKVGSIEKLCLDMSMETKEATALYREAGCKCVKGKTGMISVSLSVPLSFPPPKRGKKAQQDKHTPKYLNNVQTLRKRVFSSLLAIYFEVRKVIEHIEVNVFNDQNRKLKMKKKKKSENTR